MKLSFLAQLRAQSSKYLFFILFYCYYFLFLLFDTHYLQKMPGFSLTKRGTDVQELDQLVAYLMAELERYPADTKMIPL